MNQQIINIKGIDYLFSNSDTNNIWIGNLIIENHNINFEIYTQEFDTNEFKFFLSFLGEQNILTEIKQKAERLFINYIDVVRFGIREDIKKYSFQLEGILFRGKKSSLLFDDAYSYSLLFRLYQEKYVECDDPFGLYLADIENALITGIRREQV